MSLHELVDGGRVIAWLQERPVYCDRGRWHANIEVPMWRSDADPWPRYYFDLERAKLEVMDYLKAKKVEMTNPVWIPSAG